MTKTKKKPDNEGLDLIESPDAIVNKAEEFFNNKKNQNIVFGIGGVLALVVFGFLAYKYYITNRNQEAQEEMFQAVYYFESDSLGRALNGDGNNFGFLDIIDYYSGTKASNLAHFYAGATYLKLADYESAIRYLEGFSSSDMLVQARAYSLIGDAYVELGELDNAVTHFEKAANYQPNEEFTPRYLFKLALAQEQLGELSSAINSLDEIIEKYGGSPLKQTAEKHKARLEGLIAS